MSEIMYWTKEKQLLVAKGRDGTFTIKKNRGMYYGKYVGKTNFNLPPKKSIKELKKLIRENHYWEGK